MKSKELKKNIFKGIQHQTHSTIDDTTLHAPHKTLLRFQDLNNKNISGPVDTKATKLVFVLRKLQVLGKGSMLGNFSVTFKVADWE